MERLKVDEGSSGSGNWDQQFAKQCLIMGNHFFEGETSRGIDMTACRDGFDVAATCKHFAKNFCEHRIVAFWKQPAIDAGLNDVRHARNIGGDRGAAGAHIFDERKRQTFVMGGKHGGAAAVQDGSDVADGAEKFHAIADAEPGGEFFAGAAIRGFAATAEQQLAGPTLVGESFRRAN